MDICDFIPFILREKLDRIYENENYRTSGQCQKKGKHCNSSEMGGGRTQIFRPRCWTDLPQQQVYRGVPGCAKWRENPDEIACVQKDDAIGIMEQMITSDVVLYASPIYFWGFTSQIKSLVDRGYSLVTNYHKPGHASLMKGKRLGLLVTGGSAYAQNAEGMFTAFDRIVDFFIARKTGELFVGECTMPAELSTDIKEKAVGLARSLVSWLNERMNTAGQFLHACAWSASAIL